jgi:hypothetical protein
LIFVLYNVRQVYCVILQLIADVLIVTAYQTAKRFLMATGEIAAFAQPKAAHTIASHHHLLLPSRPQKGQVPS